MPAQAQVFESSWKCFWTHVKGSASLNTRLRYKTIVVVVAVISFHSSDSVRLSNLDSGQNPNAGLSKHVFKQREEEKGKTQKTKRKHNKKTSLDAPFGFFISKQNLSDSLLRLRVSNEASNHESEMWSHLVGFKWRMKIKSRTIALNASRVNKDCRQESAVEAI